MVPQDVFNAFSSSSQYLKKPLQQFQFYDKYSRWRNDLGRRETWQEAIQRAVHFLKELSDWKLSVEDYDRIYNAMLNMEAFCSMRLFAMAGDAGRRNNACLYNCAYLPIDSINAFVEVLLLSMSGCGVGFSVEEKYIKQLPFCWGRSRDTAPAPRHTIEDSTEGWCDAFRFGLVNWFKGIYVDFDYSQIRPAGSVLKTKGGRASGPGPLKRLFDFAYQTIVKDRLHTITSIEVHDIVTMIGQCAVSGGSRRSAQISLFDFDDINMRRAKNNGFWKIAPQRVNANNSVVLPEHLLHKKEFEKLLTNMHEARTGEPGLFSRLAARNTMPERRNKIHPFGGNPCLEVYLRPMELCNLSQAIARPNDSLDDLREKIEIATIIGCIQSMATHFPGLRSEWGRNAEEERLLGVDLTGQMDCPTAQRPIVQELLKKHAIQTAEKYSRILGINMPAAISVVKPSGNSSVLFDCSPGLHARYAPYYIRRVRLSAHSPLRHVLERSGMTLYPENSQEYETANTLVAEFPIKSPEGARTNTDTPALEQLNYWLQNKMLYTEHNPSFTCHYRKHELDAIIDWVYEHQEWIGGISFLPVDDHVYPLAPYEKISNSKYEKLMSEMPDIDFSLLWAIEKEDYTTVAQEQACFAGECLI